jgi:PKD repeat protein
MSGNVLATSNPVNELNAELAYAIYDEGTYYLEVRGTGQSDPLTKGYSSYGSVGLYNLDARFAASGSAAPSAVMTATPSAGQAPLAVQFDASSSTYSGGAAYYLWDFGDRTVDKGTNVRPLKVYNTPGDYTVSLTVVDSIGLASSTTTTISVAATDEEKMVSADTVVMSSSSIGSTPVQAKAMVTVVNQDGKPMPNSIVKVKWSGKVKSAASGRTGPDGKVYFSSYRVRSRGCQRLTVMDIKMAGYAFDKSHPQYGEICGLDMQP